MDKRAEITVNVDAMEVGDLLIIEKAGDGSIAAQEIVDFLQRVTHGDVTKLKITKLMALMDEIRTSIELAVSSEEVKN